MQKHYYGHIKDKPDERDFKYKIASPVVLPTYVDLRNLCSPVRDQKDLGSCTSFSVTALREFLENKNKSIIQKFFETLFKFNVLSPMFVYYQERVIEGTVNEDSGAEIRDGMKVLNNIGVCPESDDKYDVSKFAKAPTKTALKDAVKYKIASYHSINTLNDMKQCLASGYGFTLGFDVYDSFESDEVANTGNMPMPDVNKEQLLGGHAVTVFGYKDDLSWAGGGYFIVKNSWGNGWGSKGYFFMPYAYAQSSHVSDCWTARK